ncbi:MAG: hypothetical protein WDW38_007600 [Sanguina aurantia]
MPAMLSAQRVSSSLRCTQRATSAQRAPCARFAKSVVSRRQLVVVAEQRSPGPLSNVMQHVSALTQKYDFLSTGFGALIVTSYFVAKGQDPYTAIGITFSSTIAALVINELMPSNDAR